MYRVKKVHFIEDKEKFFGSSTPDEDIEDIKAWIDLYEVLLNFISLSSFRTMHLMGNCLERISLCWKSFIQLILIICQVMM